MVEAKNLADFNKPVDNGNRQEHAGSYTITKTKTKIKTQCIKNHEEMIICSIRIKISLTIRVVAGDTLITTTIIYQTIINLVGAWEVEETRIISTITLIQCIISPNKTIPRTQFCFSFANLTKPWNAKMTSAAKKCMV